MATYVLLPGAGGAGWYWHRVVEELRARGHDPVALTLPGPDESAGMPDYARLVVDEVRRHDDVVLVAQSMGGFTAAMAAAAVPVRELVLVNAMVPLPGETPEQYGTSSGWEQERRAAAREGGWPEDPDSALDWATYFLHDVPPGVAAAAAAHERPEAAIAFGQPCDIDRWPDVTTRVVVGAEEHPRPAPT